MHFYGYHGGNQEEQELGQPFLVDLKVTLDLEPPGKSDRLTDTVSYARLFRVVKEVMEGPPRALLEAVAADIADAILGSFPVEDVHISVKKTRPPIKGGIIDSVGVEISRARS